jgi:deazaflavin-dependent oxidoreductase (nitroreductase family)
VPEPVAMRILRNRTLMRAPIHLYHVGLGFLFGSRMLLLEHTGRVSGARREVVLEVASRPGPDRYVVVSGFGERAQWYRNLRVNPAVRVSVGRRRSVSATAALLRPERAAAVFAEYARRRPQLWARMVPLLRRSCELSPDAPLAEHIPVVELALDGR